MTTLLGRPDAILVDDNPQVLLALGMLLDVMGWNTSKTGHSEEALIQLKERDFEVAIIDLRMPDINGLELCRLIHGLKKKKPPVVFLHSGYVDAKYQAEVESLGIRAILQKPIGLSEMKDIFKKFGLPCRD